MKWNSQSFDAPQIDKMKNLYIRHEICDVDLARRFNITVQRLYNLMKKEGVYKRKLAKSSG